MFTPSRHGPYKHIALFAEPSTLPAEAFPASSRKRVGNGQQVRPAGVPQIHRPGIALQDELPQLPVRHGVEVAAAGAVGSWPKSSAGAGRRRRRLEALKVVSRGLRLLMRRRSPGVATVLRTCWLIAGKLLRLLLRVTVCAVTE